MNSDRYRDGKGPSQPVQFLSPEASHLDGEYSAESCESTGDSQPTVEAPVGTPYSSRHLEEATTLPPGHKLGSFRIRQHISSGGMGQVYRAMDERLHREVALKILPRAFARDPYLLSRFQAEARAASALNHPNIVAIHDIGREDDLCWIVSELVEGQSLRVALDADQISFRRAIEITAQIAEGLAAAHGAGFIHRDLKPENVMLTREGRVKILDFGLVKSAVRSAAAAAASVGSSSSTVTQAGVILGTPGYMSPEQIAGGAIDQRSDIFSLGVILYEMLAQRRPFTGSDRVSVLQATLAANPPALPLAVPLPLVRIIERCMEKRPERRLQSASEVAFALQVAAVGSGTLTPLPQRHSRPGRISAVIPITAACLLLAGALFWAGQYWRAPEPSLPGTLRRLTWDNALTTDGAISPDGRMVAYASDHADDRNLNIFVQQTDGGGEPLQLTNDLEENDEPTFSPDGAHIAFESRRGVGGIRQVNALRGGLRLIAAGMRHPRYSPDGRSILYARVGNEASGYGGWGTQLLVQPVAGGTSVPITQGCSEAVAEAVWSPDSQKIMAAAICGGKSGLWLFSADGKTRQLTNGADLWAKHRLNADLKLTFQSLDQWLDKPPRLLLPLLDGDTQYEAVVPLSNDGTRFLEPIRPVNFGPGMTNHGSASQDGRIALSFREHSANLWELPIYANGRPVSKPFQLTQSQGVLIHPTLSPDGRKAAFVRVHTKMDELQVLDLKTRLVTPVTFQTGYIRHPVFTPDSAKISYVAEKAAMEVSSEGGPPGVVWSKPDGYVSDWSSDGRQFLWLGRTPTQPAIFLIDRQTLKIISTLNETAYNLYQPHFSPDGRYVTFNAHHDHHSRIFAARLHPGTIPAKEWTPLTDGTTWDDKPKLSADSKLLFFISQRDGFPCIWKQRLANMQPAGEPEPVYHFHWYRRSLSGAGLGDLELCVFRDKLIFTQGETIGNIWLFDPRKDVNP